MNKSALREMNNKPTVLSMFSGCGGMDLGFHKLGYEIVWANDIDPEACWTYRENIGPINEGDVHNFNVPEIKNLDVLISGFPCQPFSNAGSRKGVSEKRGSLYQTTLTYVKKLQPKIVMLENVRGLLSIKTHSGYLLPEICEELTSLGYEVTFKLINAANYGVPQNRLRVIIVGVSKRNQLGKFSFPLPIIAQDLTLEKTIFDISEDLPNQNQLLSLNPQAIYLGSMVPEGGSWKDIPYEKLPERLKKIRNNMEKYHYPNFYRRYHRKEIAGTVTAAFKPENAGVWHPIEDRVLSVREIARIQSFPDDFIFYGSSIKSIYQMIGNAVPPKLAEVFAADFLRVLTGENCENGTPKRYFSTIKFGQVPIRINDPEVVFDNSRNFEQLKIINI